jgi:hypothetical protein
MSASSWVMGRQKVIKPIKSMIKQKKNCYLRRDVVFNEKVMILKEEGTTFDAFVYDPIKGKDERFMFHNGEFENEIIPIPIGQGVGFLVIFNPSQPQTIEPIVASTPPMLAHDAHHSSQSEHNIKCMLDLKEVPKITQSNLQP